MNYNEEQSFIDGFVEEFIKKASFPIGEMLTQGVEKMMEGLGTGIGKGIYSDVRLAIASLLDKSRKLSNQQKTFIIAVIKEDYILKKRDPKRIVSHYETLVKMAPSIALDKNAVVSFLRESTAYDLINTMTLRTLVELESKYREARGLKLQGK